MPSLRFVSDERRRADDFGLQQAVELRGAHRVQGGDHVVAVDRRVVAGALSGEEREGDDDVVAVLHRRVLDAHHELVARDDRDRVAVFVAFPAVDDLGELSRARDVPEVDRGQLVLEALQPHLERHELAQSDAELHVGLRDRARLSARALSARVEQR